MRSGEEEKGADAWVPRRGERREGEGRCRAGQMRQRDRERGGSYAGPRLACSARPRTGPCAGAGVLGGSLPLSFFLLFFQSLFQKDFESI